MGDYSAYNRTIIDNGRSQELFVFSSHVEFCVEYHFLGFTHPTSGNACYVSNGALDLDQFMLLCSKIRKATLPKWMPLRSPTPPTG
jgi:hypothetical protein